MKYFSKNGNHKVITAARIGIWQTWRKVLFKIVEFADDTIFAGGGAVEHRKAIRTSKQEVYKTTPKLRPT